MSKKPADKTWEEWSIHLEGIVQQLISDVAAQTAHNRDLETELAAARGVNDANDAELSLWSGRAHRFAEALVAAEHDRSPAVVGEAWDLRESARLQREERDRARAARAA